MFKKLLTILFISVSLLTSAQSETNDFTTYDIVVGTWNSTTWSARISGPRNMLVPGHPDAAPRPVLINMQGAGETGGVGSPNFAKYGIHYWKDNGWDGGIELGNGKHFPILITLLPSNVNPKVYGAMKAVETLLNDLPINPNAVHLSGLSMGAFTFAGLINGQYTPGGEDGMKMVTSLVLLQGDGNGYGSGIMGSAIAFDATNLGMSAFGHWAVKYGGKFFGLEGTADGSRTVWRPRDNMEDSLPGSAYFAMENINGGGHCCWNTMYDPSRKNWKNQLGDLGTNIAWNTNHPNTMGTYQNGWSIFEWQLRQGDTTLVGAGNIPPTANAGADQSITLPTNSVTVTGTANDADGTVASVLWTKISGPAGGTIVSPVSLSTSITGLTEGVYEFEFTVTDNEDASTTDRVLITVNPDPVVYPNAPIGKLVGPGEYQTYFLKNGEPWAIGNITNIGTNNTGQLGIAYRPAFPAGLKFLQCVGGLHGGAFVDTLGQVWVLGDNDQYQHGIGVNTHPIYTPSRIVSDSAGDVFNNVRSIVAFFVKNVGEGYNGFYAVKNDGTLWGWGTMVFGMRGDGTAGAIKSRPVQIVLPGDRRVKEIVSGQFTIVLCTDGTVWVWGQGASNTNIGYAGTTEDKWYPQQLTGLTNIDHIAGGMLWNYALGENKVLYGWGSYGERMGVANGLPISTPTALSNIMNNLPAPISKIVTNSAVTHVILEDSTLWGWGDNGQGTVGNGQRRNFHIDGGNPFDRNNLDVVLPVQIAPGVKFDTIFGGSTYTYHTYARDINDSLYCWGRGKGAVLANWLQPSTPAITATYGNSWDIAWPTPVDPFNIATSYIQTSDYCVKVDATGSPCNGYTIPANTAPVADAGEDQDLGDVSETTLDFTGSTDDVYISRYECRQLTGPSTVVINLPASKKPRVSNMVAGVYTFELLVEDNGWLISRDTVSVTIGTQSNEPPVITTLSSSAASIQLPTSTVDITFAATDLEGSVTKLLQVQSAPGGSAAVIGTPAGNVYSITNMNIAGTYNFRAFATDESGVTVSLDIAVTVTAAATGSGTINKYKVNISGSSVTVENGNWNNWYASANGTSIANIKDTAGVVSNLSASFNYSSVPAPNAIPTSSLPEFPDSVFQYTHYQTVARTLLLSGMKPGVPYAFDFLPYRAIANNSCFTIGEVKQCVTALGNVDSVARFSGIITDNGTVAVNIHGEPGTPAYLAAFIITEQGDEAPQNVPPLAVVDTNLHIIISPVDSVFLDGSGSTDSDGTIASYNWEYLESQVPITIDDPDADATWIRGLSTGVYTFRLTVTDNSGATDTKNVTVYVLSPVIRELLIKGLIQIRVK